MTKNVYYSSAGHVLLRGITSVIYIWMDPQLPVHHLGEHSFNLSVYSTDDDSQGEPYVLDEEKKRRGKNIFQIKSYQSIL